MIAVARSPDDASAGDSTGAYRDARRRTRAEKRQRANDRAKTCVDKTSTADPLTRSHSAQSQVAQGIAASFVAHGALAILCAIVIAHPAPRVSTTYEQAIEVLAPKKLEEPKPAIKTDPPVKAPHEIPIIPVQKKHVELEAPPPDPIDTTPPPEEPPKETHRRVVGINMESTSTTGAGASFATGNSRMGQTSLVAEDPNGIGKLAPTFSAPKRAFEKKPVYPPSLRARGVEGDVGLRVDVDEQGRVANVVVIAPSAHGELNASAVDAAKQSTYEPARANGVAVARAIELTVRFRLHE